MPRYQWLAMWTGAVLFPVATCVTAYVVIDHLSRRTAPQWVDAIRTFWEDMCTA